MTKTEATNDLTLANLKPGQEGVIKSIRGDTSFRYRLATMGAISGTRIQVENTAPMGDPRAYNLLDYTLSLRNADASQVIIEILG